MNRPKEVDTSSPPQPVLLARRAGGKLAQQLGSLGDSVVLEESGSLNIQLAGVCFEASFASVPADPSGRSVIRIATGPMVAEVGEHRLKRPVVDSGLDEMVGGTTKIAAPLEPGRSANVGVMAHGRRLPVGAGL